jgi:Skp family chaperone for outer membrane proteins
MKTRLFCLVLLVIAFISSANTWKEDELVKAVSLSRIAVSENDAEAKAAIAELRQMGPAGMQTILATHADKIKAFMETGEKTPEWLKLAAALDAVSMQKDSYASGLYWYTDLEKAKAEAQKTGKPILSLRLLGNLNEELSCANSRFFRTALYPNKEISAMLRDRFVLHWQSVRPAPRVTIDFGDGRKMETTLTGNSIHYVLDSRGKVIDAIPGLYGPDAFKQLLYQAEGAFNSLKFAGPEIKQSAIANIQTRYFSDRLQTIDENWSNDLKAAKIALEKDLPAAPNGISVSYVSAITASFRAMSKVAVEAKIIPVTVMQNRLTVLEKQTDLDKWKRLAELRQRESVLDENSRAFIRRKLGIKGAELDKLVKQFEQNLALDTVRNEYLFHTKLYTWLQEGAGEDLNKFNEKIYAELFLTPSADPWLGLYAPEIYNGIENSGISK